MTAHVQAETQDDMADDVAKDMAKDMAAALDGLSENAAQAASFLKAMSHEGRLMILCQLAMGEKSVTELEQALDARQSAVSQQLARLRLEQIVSTRRDGKTIYYTLRDAKAKKLMSLMYEMFCAGSP